MATATVTVRYFAALREHKGTDTERVSIEPGTTCAELYARLFSGRLEALPVAFARNQSYTDGSDVLEDGDELAFLPPLGGG